MTREPRLMVSLLILTGAFVVSLIVLLWREDTSPETIGIVVGAWLTGGLTGVHNFWLGSSKGSADKGEAMREQLRNPLSPQPMGDDHEPE